MRTAIAVALALTVSTAYASGRFTEHHQKHGTTITDHQTGVSVSVSSFYVGNKDNYDQHPHSGYRYFWMKGTERYTGHGSYESSYFNFAASDGHGQLYEATNGSPGFKSGPSMPVFSLTHNTANGGWMEFEVPKNVHIVSIMWNESHALSWSRIYRVRV